MIVPDPEAPGGERAKVLDFGIAKVRLGAGAHGDPGAAARDPAPGMMWAPHRTCRPSSAAASGQYRRQGRRLLAGGDALPDAVRAAALCRPRLGRADGDAHLRAAPAAAPVRAGHPRGSGDAGAQLLAKDPAQRPPMAMVAHQLEQLKAIHITGLLSTSDIALSTSQAYLAHPRTPPPIAVSAVGPNPLNTTLAQSAAQIGPPGRRGPLIAVVTICGSLLLGGAIFFVLALNRPGRDRQGTTAAPRSFPTGASGQKYGHQRPARGHRAPRPGSDRGRADALDDLAARGQRAALLILRRAGYADRVITIDQSANSVIKETLQPLAAAATTPPPPPPVANPGF